MNLQTAVEHHLREVGGEYSQSTHQIYTQGLDQYLHHIQHHFNITPHLHPANELVLDWITTFHSHIQANKSIETEHLYMRAITTLYESEHVDLPDKQLTELHATINTQRRTKSHQTPDVPIATIEVLLNRIAAHQPTRSQKDTSDRQLLQQFRDKACILLMGDHGLHLNEITDLRRRNFSPPHLILIDFPIELSPRSLSSLKHYLTARQKYDETQRHSPPPELPLFARHDKRASIQILPISRWTVHNIIKNAVHTFLTLEEQSQLTRQNISISTYTLRHYFVIQTINAHDASTAQQLARHETPSTTRRYNRLIKTNE